MSNFTCWNIFPDKENKFNKQNLHLKLDFFRMNI